MRICNAFGRTAPETKAGMYEEAVGDPHLQHSASDISSISLTFIFEFEIRSKYGIRSSSVVSLLANCTTM